MLHVTIDSKQLVFLKHNKDLTAIPLFKALFLIFSNFKLIYI